jgi:hypothetical protein
VIGVVAYGVATFGSALIIFGVIKATMGLRVSEEDEMEGLDQSEHGMHAYPDFQSISFGGVHGGGAAVPGSASARVGVAPDMQLEKVPT